jgi:hypothetical protein
MRRSAIRLVTRLPIELDVLEGKIGILQRTGIYGIYNEGYSSRLFSEQVHQLICCLKCTCCMICLQVTDFSCFIVFFYLGSDSGKVHSTVKERWALKDPILLNGMKKLADLTD